MMADQKLRACIKRIDEAETQVSKVLSETRQEINKALQEILSAVGTQLRTTPVQEVCGDDPVQPLTARDDPLTGPLRLRGSTLESHGHLDVVVEQLRSMTQTSTGADKHQDLLEIAEETAERLGLSGDDVMNAYCCFSKMDVDRDGKVSTSELQGLLQEMTGTKVDQGTVNRIVKKYDKNGDGDLDFEEFLYCFCHLPGKKLKHLKAAIYHEEDKLDQKFRTRMVGVAAVELKNYIRKEISEEQAFLQIPVICFLFLFFVLAVSFHRMTHIIHSVEQAVEFDIIENANFAFAGAAPFENGRMGSKGLYDVNAFADFWSWLHLGLAPLFFPSGWGVSEARSNIAARCTAPLDAMARLGINGETKANTPYGLNASHAALTGDLGPNLCNMEEGTAFPQAAFGGSLDAFADSTKTPYLFLNEIIAGVRMRQEQLPEVECIHPSLSKHAYTTPCIEINSDAWLGPQHDQVMMMMNDDLVDKAGGQTVYLRSGMSLTDVQSKIRSLENQRWLNQRTGKIEITLALYNNHIDAFVAVYINLLITRAGKIHKVVKPVAWFMDPYSNSWSYVVDTIFTLLVLRLLFVEAQEVVQITKVLGLKAGLKTYFSDFKNVIDWACLGYSAVVFVIWIHWLFKLQRMSDILLTADTALKGSWDNGNGSDIHTASNPTFWEEMDAIAQYDQVLNHGLAFYPLLLVLRFFSAFSSQRRLGLVTATLAAASNDLIHFGVVLGVTLLAFCTSAEILFGRTVSKFGNFGRAFVSVLQGALGDLDYDELTEVGRIPANIWWSVFMILVNCIMLNMVLAIIMDVYSNVKGSMGSDVENFPTIWRQSYQVLRRWIQHRKGLRLPLDKILHALLQSEEAHTREGEMARQTSRSFESKLISVSSFLRFVPGLGEAQAERLLGNAINYYDVRGKAEATMEDCLSGLRGLDLKIQQVQEVTDGLKDEGMASINSLTDEVHIAVPL